MLHKVHVSLPLFLEYKAGVLQLPRKNLLRPTFDLTLGAFKAGKKRKSEFFLGFRTNPGGAVFLIRPCQLRRIQLVGIFVELNRGRDQFENRLFLGKHMRSQ